ncbi:hypothetical protein Cs7R123_49140 [Catellatospora sp. TT07R-123]|uniref:hypothetical protein n=1 Tax=Catellatospora sp. TT07R-123 TaxID=2733863 RepID=UPI001B26B62C|nr:hypothetical protein [Catellatospora sp. TT07R-123]GHJ47572.1 hypothetical protein Cs7R123_49140 [Catellatospora sp. TT07R-123]
MTDSTRPDKIEQNLRNMTEGRSSQELVFDPRTGQLRVTSQPHPDDIVATDAAATGYFR